MRIYGNVEYIHPYGRGFLIYTDKEWSRGIVKMEDDALVVIGTETVRIPIPQILSIDKSINLPVLKEGRAFLLVEYINIKKRENVYLLLSAEEGFIRRLRMEILKSITYRQNIMFRIGEKWYPGKMVVEGNTVIFSGHVGVKINVKDIQNVERRKIEYGFRKIGVISIEYRRVEEKEEIILFVEPLKRMFFWQLIHQIMEDYINTEIVGGLSNVEKMVLHLINKDWSYGDIKSKLELGDEEMSEIVEKLARHGIVRKIIILKLTDKGKRVLNYISEGDFE